MILIITYDLKSNRDYTTLFEAVKSLGTWWHYMASTWLVSTDKSPEQVALDLHAYMDPQDSLLVDELGPAPKGYLPAQAWEWIVMQRKLEAERHERLERAKLLLMGAPRSSLSGALSPIPPPPSATEEIPPNPLLPRIPLRPPGKK